MQLRDNDTDVVRPAPVGDPFFARVVGQMRDHARKIAHSLVLTVGDRPGYVLGITSALPGEGKTTISLAVAEVMATDFGLEVVLLDTHAERPWSRIDPAFATKPGLGDCLSGTCSLLDSLILVSDRYALLPFGTQSFSSEEVLQYLRDSNVLRRRKRNTLFVMDLPDLANPVGTALANQCDGILLIVHSGETHAEAVRAFLPMLKNVIIHGTVLNRYSSAVSAALQRLLS